MRGLQEAYNNIKQSIDKYYSKEEMTNRARKKLLTNEILVDSYFDYPISTQRNIFLSCRCNPTKISYDFNLRVPLIELRQQALYSTVLDRGTSYDSLCYELYRHKDLCMSSCIASFGDLIISSYPYPFRPYARFLTGMVNHKIVFLFRLSIDWGTHLHITNIALKDNFIYFTIMSSTFSDGTVCSVDFKLSLSDYSLERLGDTQ